MEMQVSFQDKDIFIDFLCAGMQKFPHARMQKVLWGAILA